MTENEISYKIRGAAFQVYNKLGPGLLESVYEEALTYELEKRNMKVDRQVYVPIKYDNTVLKTELRLDMLVEDKVIVELKSVTEIKNVFFLQLHTYLKLSGKHLGLLINVNTDDILGSIHRRVY